MSRVAVVGSGIAGLVVAHRLSGHADVTLFEAGDHFGGHGHTVDLTLGGVTHGVDTGFLVLNDRTYPKLVGLFAQLGVETAPSEMSFSVQAPEAGIEWSGNTLASVFADRRNLVRPAFWRMLADLLRFNRVATALAESAEAAGTVGDFLDRHRFSAAFRDWYFLPMVGSIWSCPVERMLAFPVATMLSFCRNHGLLQIADRPQWRTVRGGAREYVGKMLATVSDTRLATPVRRVVRRGAGGVELATDHGSERFDEVVLACHSGQSLALLAEPTAAERRVLGAIRTHRNRAVLHTDARLLPTRRAAWAAWNYERAADASREKAAVCLHYWINRLQPLPFDVPVIVSLNPVREPDPARVHGEYDYAHPVFDAAAIAAQALVPSLQGVQHTWYCGAWTRHGFHEDGLASGLAVADALETRLAEPAREPA